jgi:ubiquinone/menaquinone biosynthesis C-methylase UbiE
MTPPDPSRTFLPAAGRDFLLPLYDPIVRLLGADRATLALIDQAAIVPGERILDIGYGTGTLLVELKRRHPDATVVGLDPDPKAHARARAKAQRAGVTVVFDRGFADQLPYADDSFDRVFSSFMLHHLAASERAATLREVRRVLKPGGTFHLLDFVHEHGDERGVLARLLHTSASLQDNGRDRVLGQLADAGLATPREVTRRELLLGSAAYYQANAPA